MAHRRVYSFCIVTLSVDQHVTDVAIGFTVATSSDDISRIVTEHVTRGKRFILYTASAGSSDPMIAPREAAFLARLGHQWVEPFPDKRSSLPLEERVMELMLQPAD